MDRRGQESAALIVKRAGGGYGGFDDRHVEISVCDHPPPSAKLERLYAIHRLTYLPSDPDKLVVIDAAIANVLDKIMLARGFRAGPVSGVRDPELLHRLLDFMGWEN